MVDKFNATVPNATVQYGTGLTIFTCDISHLAMRFVMAAGPYHAVQYSDMTYIVKTLYSKITPILKGGVRIS